VIIAEREFSIVNNTTQLEKKVIVRLRAPTPGEKESNMCRCGYEIEVDGKTKVQEAWGIDGFQAIGCAFAMLASYIDWLRSSLDGRIIWLEHEADVAEMHPPPDFFYFQPS
jgi:hypothetical protein